MKITILGCGPSGGVPLLGCTCATCQSGDPKNNRTRASILIETKNKRFLVDTSPDLRQQSLKTGFTTVDAIFYTHNHADHTHGIDETRAFNYHRKAALSIYGTAEFLEQFTRQFSYAFQPPRESGSWSRPSLIPNTIAEYADFKVEDIRIQSFLQYHGKGKSLGYRIGNFAYSTDVNNFPDESLQLLDSLDVWVVDCLRRTPAPTHADLALTLSWIERLKPKRAILTHMSHEMEYHALKAELPGNVVPAYDGMTIELAD